MICVKTRMSDVTTVSNLLLPLCHFLSLFLVTPSPLPVASFFSDSEVVLKGSCDVTKVKSKS